MSSNESENREEQTNVSREPSVPTAVQLTEDYITALVNLRQQTPTGSIYDINPRAIAGILARTPWFPRTVEVYGRYSRNQPPSAADLETSIFTIHGGDMTAPRVAAIYADLFRQAYDRLVQYARAGMADRPINPNLLQANIPEELIYPVSYIPNVTHLEEAESWRDDPSIEGLIMRAYAASSEAIFASQSIHAHSRALTWNYPAAIPPSTRSNEILSSTLNEIFHEILHVPESPARTPSQNPSQLIIRVLPQSSAIPRRRAERAERHAQLHHYTRMSPDEMTRSDARELEDLEAEEDNYVDHLTRLRRIFTPNRPYDDQDDDGPDIDDLTSVTDSGEEMEDFILRFEQEDRVSRIDLWEQEHPPEPVFDFMEVVPVPGDLSLLERVEDYAAAEGEECAICLEVIPNSDTLESHSENFPARVVTCVHIFHRKCIQGWLGGRNTCPLCRSRIERD